MKKYILVLLFIFSNFCFAQEQNLYDYTPKTSGYFSIDNGFTVQIISYRTEVTYNVFNDLRGSVDVLAWKSDKEYVTLIVRLRGWNTDKNAEYYSIVVDGRTTNAKGNSKILSQLPDLSDYYINSAYTNDAAINLRAGSNVKSNKVGQYQKNNVVVFTGKTENKCSIDGATDYWFSIDYSGVPAWIYGKYITFAGSVKITLESLGVIKKENTNVKGFNQISDLKLNCFFDSSKPVYNIYRKDDTLITVENSSYNSFGLINIKKGNKQLAEIETFQYSVYSSKFNKLFYLTNLMDKQSFAYSIDCNTGNGEQLQTVYNSELTLYYAQIFLSNDETKLFAVDCTYSYNDIPYLAILEIDVESNKILHTYTSDFSPYKTCTFGKLNDEIFYFVMDTRENTDANQIKFVKIQDDKLVEIGSFKFEDYDFIVEYPDEVFSINLHKSNHSIIHSRDYRNERALIFEYKDGKVVECSSKVKGNVLASFYMNDNWYLLSAEKNTGAIHLYDANFVELITKVCEDYTQDCYIFTKVGFDSDGNLTVIFEFSK